MSMSDLVFDIFAIDRASAVFTRVGASADATARQVKRGNEVMSTAMLGAGAVALGLGVKSLTMAASFDSAMTRLTTTAGESPAAMKMVSQGILDMAGKVGYTAQQLSVAMYQVESGGFHGSAALKVLKDAAQGAAVEGANVTDVAHALAGALNDYRGTTLTSTEATNAMTAAVGHGMMTFQDLAEAMPKIGARAAAARVTFSEMTAALGTMTRDGLPAAVAATYLGQTIGQLAAPSAKARIEMKGLGIDATAVASTITSGSGHGLGDALKMLYDGIQKHLVGGGLVSVDTFKKMSKSSTDFQQVLAKLPPATQTSIQAIATMSGGVKSMQGVLMLGGQHAGQYAETLKGVNDQIRKGGDTIAGMADVNKTLSQQWKDLKGSASALGVEIGNDLMPAALDVTHAFQDFFGFLQNDKGTVEAVGIAAASVAGALVLWKGAALGVAAAEALATATTTGFGLSELALAAQLAVTSVFTGEAAAGFSMLGAAMEATPIGLIATAIGGLGIGVYELWQHLGPAESAAQQLSDQIYKTNTEAAQREFSDLAGTLNQVTGAYGSASRAAVEHSLYGTDGKLAPYVQMLTQAGVSLGTITSALMGQKGPLDAVNAAKQKQLDLLHATLRDMQTLQQLQLDPTTATAGQGAKVTADEAKVATIRANINGLNTALGIAAATQQKVIQDSGAINGLGKTLSMTKQQLETAVKFKIDLVDIPTGEKALADMATKLGLFRGQVQQLATATHTSFHSLAVDMAKDGDQAAAGWLAALAPVPSKTVDIGAQVVAGLIAGMQSQQGPLNAVVAMLGNSVPAQLRNALKTHSPSRVTQQIGEYVVDGLVVGMTRSQHLAEVAAKQIATAMHKSLMQGLHVEQLQLGFDLSAAQASLSKINNQISTATTWADSFKDNPFTANLATAATTYHTKNGIQYAITGNGVDSGSTVAAMIAYEKQQQTKNVGLDADVQKLRKMGLSAGLIAQMQQGGDAGIPEITALASATKSEIQQLNGLFNSSTAHLQDAGAYATTGQSLHALHVEQHNDARQVANIKKALAGLRLQIADGGHVLRVT